MNEDMLKRIDEAKKSLAPGQYEKMGDSIIEAMERQQFPYPLVPVLLVEILEKYFMGIGYDFRFSIVQRKPESKIEIVR